MQLNVDRKIVAAVAAALAAIATRKVLAAAWQLTTGRTAPNDPEHPDTNLTEALVFTVASGALVALARLVAARSAIKLVPGPPKSAG